MGAEIKEIRQEGQAHNWIWPSTEPWKRSAPVLFPIVGKLKEDRYFWKEKAYRLDQHGFARDLSFSLIQHSADRILFRLQDSPRTLERFPFQFCLDVEYIVQGRQLQVFFCVKNPDHVPLFFNLGWHPAFVLPGQMNSECLILQGTQAFEKHHVLEAGLISRETFQSLAAEKDLILQSQIFDHDALLFLNTRQTEFMLKDNLGNEVKISGEGVPHWGLWTKDVSKFVCVEPWWGHADTLDVDGELSSKPGIQMLPPGESWQGQVSVEINPGGE